MSRAPSSSLLRSRAVPDSGKVGWVELFFDLVFVFAVTQLSHTLLHHLAWGDAAKVAFLTVAVWVSWMWTTWATNWLDTGHAAVRLMLFALMAAALVLAAAIPKAFADAGIVFACAYAFIHNARNAFTVFALRGGQANEYRNFQRIQIWLLLSAVLWIAGGLAQGPTRWALWVAALALEFLSPWWGFWVPGLGASRTADWAVDPAHMAERCGLFVIVALGESIILTGATFAELPWTAARVAGFAVAFVGTVATWWVYFATTAEEATHRFENMEAPGRHARAAYTYAHIPIVAGIILSAVGDGVVLQQPDQVPGWAGALVAVGGPGLFLIGSALFRTMICGDLPLSHAAGLVALALAGVALPSAPPLWLAGITAVILGAVGAYETLRARRADAAHRR